MKKLVSNIKHILKRLAEHVHELGAIYYLWGIIAAVAGVAYSIYKQMVAPAINIAGTTAFLIFVITIIIAALMLPILMFVILRRTSETTHPISNPTLAIDSRECEYEIWPQGVKKVQKLKLRALEETGHYKFRLKLTGGVSSKVSLLSSGAKLLGPIEVGSGDAYHVKFDEPLEKNQITHIETIIEISDPNQTMRKFVADDFSNAASYGLFSAKYTFKQRPQKVFKQMFSSATGEKVSDLEELFPDNEQQISYSIKLNNPTPLCTCNVGWIW